MATAIDTTQSVPANVMESASKVAACVEIAEVRLVDVVAHLTAWGPNRPQLVSTSQGAKAFRRAAESQIRIETLFSFKMAEDSDESKQNPPLTINATYSIVYHVESLDEFSDEDIQSFGAVNGVYNAWPFWRELVYSTMSRMGLPPTSLPVYRVVPEEERAENGTDSPRLILRDDVG